MSDNITREPYRNAWYKQLSDAVKKHDEEIAEMTPHLVPDVEEGDNGKILIAGEEGAFDWGQPPEELPIITEGDEGKVLKVDEGVPKWLEDKDAEIPSHTASDEGKMLSVNAQNALEWKDVPDEIPSHTASDEGKMLSVNAQNALEWKDVPDEIPSHTASDEGKMLSVNAQNALEWKDIPDDWLVINMTVSGTSPNLIHTIDKTYNEIRPYAEKGKCVIKFIDSFCFVSFVYANSITFDKRTQSQMFLVNSSSGGDYTKSTVLSHKQNLYNIRINSDNTIEYIENNIIELNNIAIQENDTAVNDMFYNIIKAIGWYNASIGITYFANNIRHNMIMYSRPQGVDEFTFICIDLGLLITIHTDKSITKASIPMLPTPPSTDGTYTLQCTVSSGVPTYSWV